MNILIIFLFGIGFSLIAMPIIQCFTDIVYLLAELVKAKISVIITKYNVTITELSSPPERTNAIGFSIPSDVNEEYYDDDDDDNGNNILKNQKNQNRKIGF